MTITGQNCRHSDTKRSNRLVAIISPVSVDTACTSPMPVMNAVMTMPRKNMISVLKNTFWIRRNATLPGFAS